MYKDNTFSEYIFITAIWYSPYFFKYYPGKLIFLTSSGGETIGEAFKILCIDFDHILEKRRETIQGGFSSREDTD